MIRVQTEAFDMGQELNAFTAANPAAGAIVSFLGQVRGQEHDAEGGRTIHSLTLEHYPGMTEKELARLEAEARERWPVDDVLIVHRHGKMDPSEPIVAVFTASAHRAAAFEAAEFLMDFLKTQAPFWKLEDTGEGSSWVDARAEDDARRDRWESD